MTNARLLQLRTRVVPAVLAVITLAAVSSTIAASPASAAAVTPAATTNGHTCDNFGIVYRGYKAAECADILFSIYPTSEAATGEGEAFCQVATTGTIVQCKGISQYVYFNNRSTGETRWASRQCGSYGGYQACPTGRFYTYSPSFAPPCGLMQAEVVTTIALPVDGTATSSGWHTDEYQFC